jgi:hypothetical protein
VGPVTEQKVKCNDPHGGRGRVCERDTARVRVSNGMTGQNYCVIGGCLLSFSLCRRGFQDLLKVRPSYLFIFCECISSSIQTPGNYPEENRQHTEHGESLKRKTLTLPVVVTELNDI